MGLNCFPTILSTSSYLPSLESSATIINIVGISMIQVSNVNFTDTDVDSLMKSTNLCFPIFIGSRFNLFNSKIS